MDACGKCGKQLKGFFELHGSNGLYIDRKHPEYKGKKLCESCRYELRGGKPTKLVV